MNNNQLCFPECGGKKIKIKLAHNSFIAVINTRIAHIFKKYPLLYSVIINQNDKHRNNQIRTNQTDN